jgi:hypothetical protein
MYTIVDSQSGLVLFSKNDSNVLEGQTAINKVCTIETQSEIYYNFETQQFYIQE